VESAREKRGALSVYEQDRAEFFDEINYQPNDCQEMIHRALDAHRRVYAGAHRRAGLTTGLVFEALWQVQRDKAQVVLVAPNFVIQMIHRRLLQEIIVDRDRLFSESLPSQRAEEFSFTDGRSIVTARASKLKGVLGRPITAVLYDDAEQGKAWPWAELEKILIKNGGCALVASRGNFSSHWIPAWCAAVKPHEIIYPLSQGYGGRDRGNDDGRD